MATPTPRRLRVARAAPASGPGEPRPSSPAPPGVRRLTNRGAVRRARRIALLYVLGLAVLYLGFALTARAAPGAGSSGARGDLELFGAVAVVLAVGGATVALLSAPAFIDVGTMVTVVVSPLGTRRAFAQGPSLSVRVLRRIPTGWFSRQPLEAVEVVAGPIRRTYVLDDGLAGQLGAGGS